MRSRGRPTKKRSILARYPTDLVLHVDTDFHNPRKDSILGCECVNPVITMGIDHLEAIRLVDYVRMPQYCAANLMRISQTTFHTILWESRRKMSLALIEGKTIEVQYLEHLSLNGEVTVQYACNTCKRITFVVCCSKHSTLCGYCGSDTLHRMSCPEIKDIPPHSRLSNDARGFLCYFCPKDGTCNKKAHARDQSLRLSKGMECIIQPTKEVFVHKNPWEDHTVILKPSTY